MIKKFLALLLLCALCLSGAVSEAFAIDYNFYYDNNVSAARNRAAEYAYEILNYNWYANGTIKLWKRNEYRSYQNIRGIPYSLHTQMTFEGYKNLSDYQKYSINGNGMLYGMACAKFVTDCIRQGFLPDYDLPTDTRCLFHKRYGSYYGTSEGWNGHVDTVSDKCFWADHSKSQWYSIWDEVKSNYVEHYKKLRRGDYVDNYDHVRLVIDNDGSKIKYIDQTPYWDGNNDVGTHIGEAYYSSLNSNHYIPMYVKYPNDESDPSSDPDNIQISNPNNFKSIVFRVYLRQFDTNSDGYLSKAEREAVKGIDVRNRQVNSLVGIKYFPNLEYLYCNGVGLTGNLDLSGLTKLTLVWAMDNKLTSLNVNNCTSLPELWAYNNKLTKLNVTGCTNLKKIVVYNNSFTSLSLMECPSLEELWIGGCNSLKRLECYGKVNVNGVEKPTITTQRLPDGYVGVSYRARLQATAKVSPISYKLNTVASANGLKCDPNTGIITGTPKYARTFTTTASVRNAGGLTQKNFSITIRPKPKALKIDTISLPSGTVGKNYSATLSASEPDVKWTKTGGTATWAKVSSNGKITGKPTKAGTFTIRISATNSTGSARKTLSIKVVRVSNTSSAFDGVEAEDESENQDSEHNAVLDLVSSDDVKFTFALSSWNDNDGETLQVNSEDLTVYINDEPNENIKVNDENIFEIAREDINFEAGSAVYVEAAVGAEDEVLTSNIIDLESASENNESVNHGSSSGCSSGLYSLALFFAIAALRKFKK